MIVFTDEACLGYGSAGHPERAERVSESVRFLKQQHPDWEWRGCAPADLEVLRLAHSEAHVERLEEARHFDADTAYFDGIFDIARLATGAALAAVDEAMEGRPAFSLMRPPGHHAETERAMGFCYLSHAAILAKEALAKRGLERVAVWDFDAHHGNGTEEILNGMAGTLYASVHQHPCYPGTGTESRGNCLNFPVAPMTASDEHMRVLRDSWDHILKWNPQLVLVSAGFDAYERDPITDMRLKRNDFEVLGNWLRESGVPTAALLEGGYSEDLPVLIDAFLTGWNGR